MTELPAGRRTSTLTPQPATAQILTPSLDLSLRLSRDDRDPSRAIIVRWS